MSSCSSSLTYKLVLVQQPTIGSAFEDNLLGRLGLAPPLIVELQVFRDGKISDATAELPFLICQCSLLDEQGRVADMVDQRVGSASQQSQEATTAPAAVSAVPRRGRSVRNKISHRGGLADGTVTPLSLDSTEASTSGASEDTLTPGTGEPSATQLSGRNSPQIVRMLYGTLAAGPQQYISPNADEEEKAYFFFPELSIRTPGRFKIICTLLRLSLPGMEAAEVGSLASLETQTFEVVKRTDYSAPYITDISRHFARQGVPLLLPPGVSAE